MEKAILVGIQLPGVRKKDVEDSLSELRRLTETDGASAVETVIQKREQIDSAYFIGRGKAEQLRDLIREQRIRTVIFDDELRPVQQKNLEETIEAKIIDRTRLILDIFAKRARSREGSLQVERAQLEYYLPRLTKKGLLLDNQVGGIGTRRGPGEKKLEIDQRRIRERIARLDREIKGIGVHRELLRRRRQESGQPIVAIVGYTNAGKSTLLNTLNRNRAVYADDKLFATLDPTTRQVPLPGGRIALFVDTVGFINKLPHALVAAFRATLDEVRKANCLLHLIDVSHPDYEKQVHTVLRVLKELGAENVPVISAYSKADRLLPEQRARLERQNYFLISARTGEGVDELLRRLEAIVTPKLSAHRFVLPYGRSQFLGQIYELAVVTRQEYGPRGIALNIESTPGHWEKIRLLAGMEKEKTKT
ncbi:MAG: GTPase HflX [Endomicrobiales bacterium]